MMNYYPGSGISILGFFARQKQYLNDESKGAWKTSLFLVKKKLQKKLHKKGTFVAWSGINPFTLKSKIGKYYNITKRANLQNKELQSKASLNSFPVNR